MKKWALFIYFPLIVLFSGQVSATIIWSISDVEFDLSFISGGTSSVSGSMEWDGSAGGPATFQFEWTGGSLDGQVWSDTTGYSSISSGTFVCFVISNCAGPFGPNALFIQFPSAADFADPANSPIINTDVRVRPAGAPGFFSAANPPGPGQWTEAAAVPEPATFWLTLVGLLGLVGAATKRKLSSYRLLSNNRQRATRPRDSVAATKCHLCSTY